MRRSVESSDLLKVIRSLFAVTLKLQKHIGIKENAEVQVQCHRISSNNSRPSINRLPRIIATPPPQPLSPSSLPDPVKLKCNVIQPK